MLWRKRTHTPITHTTAPVPDTEALRRALLHASQRRSRWVSRRRVALRWALWGLRRAFLPVLLLLAVAVAVMRWQANAWDATPAPIEAPPKAAPLTMPHTSVQPVQPAPAAETETEPETDVHLRLEPAWRGNASVPPAPTPTVPGLAAPEAAADPTPPPHLKPENWLHSKEP